MGSASERLVISYSVNNQNVPISMFIQTHSNACVSFQSTATSLHFYTELFPCVFTYLLYVCMVFFMYLRETNRNRMQETLCAHTTTHTAGVYYISELVRMLITCVNMKYPARCDSEMSKSSRKISCLLLLVFYFLVLQECKKPDNNILMLCPTF